MKKIGKVILAIVLVLVIAFGIFCWYKANHPFVQVDRAVSKTADGSGEFETFIMVSADRWYFIPNSWKATAELRLYAMWNKSVFDYLYSETAGCDIHVSGETKNGKTTLRYEGTVTNPDGEVRDYCEKQTFRIPMRLVDIPSE